MAYKKGGLRFGYHDRCAVDGGKARIILDALVTPADVMENLLHLRPRARRVPLPAATPTDYRGGEQNP
jgi:hypothetical protein